MTSFYFRLYYQMEMNYSWYCHVKIFTSLQSKINSKDIFSFNILYDLFASTFRVLTKLNHLPEILFLLIFLYQKVKKDPEMTKEPSFGTPRGVWTCFLTLSLRTTPFGGFPDYFSFSYFLTISYRFQKKRPSPLDFALNFTQKQPQF